jgi:hypothetical protein
MHVLILFFSILFQISKSATSATLDLNHLYTGVWLSGAAYCNKENYKTMTLGGEASGFVYKDTLYDSKTDLQGYVGTLSTSNSIYVVLRGSSSIINWLDNFEVKLIPYTSYPNCNCSVHNGFYRSALGIKNKTIETVKTLQKIYPNYSVVVTGHSYGAACGQLLAMELEKEGIKTKVYNYGQPRVGDIKYANFVNTILKENWRATHNQDIVPHVPPVEGFGYFHSCREIFEDKKGTLNECSNINCEDPKCADQFSLMQTNSSDHLYYLAHRVSCDESLK